MIEEIAGTAIGADLAFNVNGIPHNVREAAEAAKRTAAGADPKPDDDEAAKLAEAEALPAGATASDGAIIGPMNTRIENVAAVKMVRGAIIASVLGTGAFLALILALIGGF